MEKEGEQLIKKVEHTTDRGMKWGVGCEGEEGMIIDHNAKGGFQSTHPSAGPSVSPSIGGSGIAFVKKRENRFFRPKYWVMQLRYIARFR